MIPKIGAQHGRLTVAGYRTITKRAVFVVCECGRTKTILVENLARTHSCGCLNRDVARARETTHGMTRSRTYNIWGAMIRRCYSAKASNYSNYGGRGIAVCDAWRKFEGFFADMGVVPEGLSLERIDNDGDYETGNCKWATATEQANNRRKRRSVLDRWLDDQHRLGRELEEANSLMTGLGGSPGGGA